MIRLNLHDGEREALVSLAQDVYAHRRARERAQIGDGAKGPRRFEWARFLAEPGPEGHEHWFLVRRSLDEHHEMAYYRVFGASSTSLEDMARAAGTRWAVEECFEQAKGDVGLDQYEVRSWLDSASGPKPQSEKKGDPQAGEPEIS